MRNIDNIFRFIFMFVFNLCFLVSVLSVHLNREKASKRGMKRILNYKKMNKSQICKDEEDKIRIIL